MKASTKRLLSIFLALALIGAAAFIVLNQSLGKWKKLQGIRQEVAEKTAVRNQLVQIAAKAQELLARFEDVDRQAEPISRAVPAGPKLPEALAILGALASQNNLSLGQVSFDDILIRPDTASAATPRAVPVKVLMTLTGRYTDFKNWLKAIESELRLMDVEEIGIQGISSKAGEELFSFSVHLTAYFQPRPAPHVVPADISQTQNQ